jgi:hypothetical protein
MLECRVYGAFPSIMQRGPALATMEEAEWDWVEEGA